MHTAIQSTHFEQVVEKAWAAQLQWVEQADFNVGVLMKAFEGGVEAYGIIVIQQQAHFNTTLGSLVQGFK